MLIRSRREFLRDAIRSVSAVGALGGLTKFGEMNALAAGSSYQALVCIYLAGGNDGHNTVVPVSTAQQSYSLYQNARGALAIPQSSLLAIQNGGDVYGLHPQLAEIQSLYAAGHAAVLANVGMLVEPISRAIYNTNNSSIVPNALFSKSVSWPGPARCEMPKLTLTYGPRFCWLFAPTNCALASNSILLRGSNPSRVTLPLWIGRFGNCAPTMVVDGPSSSRALADSSTARLSEYDGRSAR